MPNRKICTIACILVVTIAQMSRAEDDDVKESLAGMAEEVIAEDEILEKDPSTMRSSGDVEDPDLPLDNDDDVFEDNQGECSRISPKEIFHTELHLRLLHIMDEMSHFVESVLNRIESALMVLLPHVQESPIGELNVEELFPEVRHFMFGTMKDVYNLVRSSWRELIRTQIASRNDAKLQLEALGIVRAAQIQGEEKLRASLMELSITIKAIVLNSIHVLQDSLNLPKNTEDDQAAVFIARSLPKVAPNFLGTLMMKILEKGQDPEAYEKILTNTLRYLTEPVDQMYHQLQSVVETGGDPEDLMGYWRSMMEQCHSRLINDPLRHSDFEFIFQNEEYLAGLVLGLIATF